MEPYIFDDQVQKNMNLISWSAKTKQSTTSTAISVIEQYREVSLMIDIRYQTRPGNRLTSFVGLKNNSEINNVAWCDNHSWKPIIVCDFW